MVGVTTVGCPNITPLTVIIYHLKKRRMNSKARCIVYTSYILFYVYLFVGPVNIEAKMFVWPEWCNCHVVMDVGGHEFSRNNVVM